MSAVICRPNCLLHRLVGWSGGGGEDNHARARACREHNDDETRAAAEGNAQKPTKWSAAHLIHTTTNHSSSFYSSLTYSSCVISTAAVTYVEIIMHLVAEVHQQRALVGQASLSALPGRKPRRRRLLVLLPRVPHRNAFHPHLQDGPVLPPHLPVSCMFRFSFVCFFTHFI